MITDVKMSLSNFLRSMTSLPRALSRGQKSFADSFSIVSARPRECESPGFFQRSKAVNVTSVFRANSIVSMILRTALFRFVWGESAGGGWKSR